MTLFRMTSMCEIKKIQAGFRSLQIIANYMLFYYNNFLLRKK